MDQAPQPGTRYQAGPVERLVGGGADGDVVPVPGDPVRTERRHHLGPFVQQDGMQPFDQLLEVRLGNMPVRVAQPFVAHRDGAVGAPGVGTFHPPPRTQGRRAGRDPGGDLPRRPVRCQHQHKPEPRIVLVQGDGSGTAIGVIVGMGDDDRDGMRLVHGQDLSRARCSKTGSGILEWARSGPVDAQGVQYC